MDMRTHIRIWVGLFALCLFLSPLFRSAESMEAFARAEIEATEATFGPSVGGWVKDSVGALFKSSPAAAVTTVAAVGTTSKERQDKIGKNLGKGAKGLTVMANSYFTGVILAVFIACVRLLVLAVWFGMLAPVLVAAVIDGFSQRAVKAYRFGSIRPAAFSILGMIVVPFVFAPLLYLTLPFSVPPTIVPLWVFLGCIPLSALIANTQPVFGRH